MQQHCRPHNHEMSHHVMVAGFKFRLASFWQLSQIMSTHVAVSIGKRMSRIRASEHKCISVDPHRLAGTFG